MGVKVRKVLGSVLNTVGGAEVPTRPREEVHSGIMSSSLMLPPPCTIGQVFHYVHSWTLTLRRRLGLETGAETLHEI